MVVKAKPKTKPVAAKAKDAASWPFPKPSNSKLKPKPKVAAKKPASLKHVSINATGIKKHVVRATLSNVELAKAKSALSLDLFANDKKIGNLEVGQGSFFWKGAGKQKSKPIDWTRFAAMMNDLAYGNK